MRAELDRQSPWQLDVQEHALLGARSSDGSSDAPFVAYLRSLYGAKPPDLVIAVGAPATGFLQRYRQELFPAVPMVITTIEQRRVQAVQLTSRDTVVSVRHDFRVLFESFLRIAPDTKVIAIVNGSSPNEKFWQGEMRRELKPLEERVELRWLDHLPFDDIVTQAASLPPNSGIFWYQMIVDAAGETHEGDRALSRLYATANAPIFSHDDSFLGETIGGPMHSALAGGNRAAAVAMRILGGESPGDIKTEPSNFAPPKYDWRLLRRWGIDKDLLPPDSQMLFRVPPVWETYYWQFALICAALLLQGGLIAGLLNERRSRQAAQLQSRQRMTELAHVNRHSMAGELAASMSHELNQPLGAMLSNIETAELMISAPSPDLHEIGQILADIKRDDHRASEVLRRLRSMLKKTPFEPSDVDLNNVVQETVEFVLAVARMRGVSLSTFVTRAALPIKGDPVQLQQVIMNLMLNAADAMAEMPSGQREIEIRTGHVQNEAELSVRDTGPGIPPDKLRHIFEPFFTTKPTGMGMGLSIARTIVEAHNGTISAENRAGGGAIFRIRLPLT